MGLQLGQTAPDFTLDSTEGTVNFHDWAEGKWVVLFSHPADYTPICTTELGEFAKRKGDFDKRDTKIIGLSVDPVASHNGWAKDISKVGGTDLNFPILADPELEVAKTYGMYHPEADAKVTVRSVFFIDPSHTVRTILTYPPSAGRSIDEIFRVIDSLQQIDKQGVATPIGWQPGNDVVIPPPVSDEDAEKKYPGKVRKELDYLRYVPAE